MTRLDQALRWWRNRPCECNWGDCSVEVGKIISILSIPSRHWLALRKVRAIKVFGSNFWILASEKDLPMQRHGPPDES